MTCDYEFYKVHYLLGREAVLSAADFPYFTRKASQVIEKYTLGNINPNEPILEAVQMCCCELAEYLYRADQSSQTPIGISSESVGKHSISYESAAEIKVARESDQKEIIYDWLSETGLLYCGVR